MINESPERILVIQLRQLGDILMITPLLRQLKRRFPQAVVDVLCEKIGVQLLEHNPHVRRTMLLKRGGGIGELLRSIREIRHEAYDWVLDCQSLPKTGLLSRGSGARVRCSFGGKTWRPLFYNHCYNRRNADYSALDKLKLASCLPAFQLDPTDLQLDFHVSEKDRQIAADFCETHFKQVGTIECPGPGQRWKVAALFGVSRAAYKIWPPEKLGEIGRRLSARGYRLFVVHGPGEEEAANELISAIGPGAFRDLPMLNFAQLKEVLGQCACFIGNDGGPKHLAAAGGTPTLALFGRVHPQAWTKPGDPSQLWLATASASREIPTTGACEETADLSRIDVDRVWAALEQLLAGSEAGQS